ncbi:MAG: hypothetical protein OEX81_01330 [Candidatus Pacebacteria bacterium]|nr:hypothetical protein [Candidatus Paceibacterota bacterium]
MKKNISPKLIAMKKSSWDQFLAKLAIFVSILMIVGGAIGMILVQKDLKLSQDLRQQASVADGKVSVTMSAADLGPNQPGKINFSINTAGVQTDGVQLTFNVVTDTLPNPPVFTILDSAPLQLAYSEVETTADGYLVSIIALPKQISQPFSSNTATPFASLDVNPTKSGTITLNFDVENSISTVHASSPVKDELTHIATTSFDIGTVTTQQSCQTDTDCSNGEICYQPPMPPCPDGMGCAQVMPAKYCAAPTASPSPSASPDACTRDNNNQIVCAQFDPAPGFCEGGTILPGITDECGCAGAPRCEYPDASPEASPDASPETSPSPSPSASPAVSPDPTDDPGIGGNPDIASCNESCAVNADCDVNLRCYSGQCRLVTNVTSNTCSNPTDQGLSFNCNEYCSDSNECADGLVCQNNSCRNPENLSSTTCSDLTIAQRSSVVKSCNESCSSNNDCDVNLRCYQGACRLATNPGSYSCNASTKKLVSKSVYGGTTTSKGSGDGSTETGKTDPNKAVVGEITIDSDKTMQKPAGTDNMDKDLDGMEDEETALDVVKNYFMANPKLPIIFMGIGLGLITAIILLAFLKRKKDDKEPPMPPTSGGAPGSGTPAGAVYEKNIQDRINSLKKESIQTQGVGTNIPPAMSPPVARMPIPQNTPIKNNTGEVFSNQNRPSSMLDKLKNKDITPPSV